jgi:hypothetical protein
MSWALPELGRACGFSDDWNWPFHDCENFPVTNVLTCPKRNQYGGAENILLYTET